ncbi:helix-turn-helix domain-containing protein [Kitasatospora sp. NPDC052896]|uniref:helix-turn-helix domain-containing protein n=1 Tax=Kitasatospora sp. NPDC052896 TaxID=3364061 RepID=UPI0037C52178
MTEDTPDRPAMDEVAVLDAKGLRALAHPVRVRLLGLLRRYGPSTATRLAERMGLTSGATSYHLRRLGEAGFVAEDPERGNARERWWRAVHRTTSFNDLDLLDQEPEAVEAYLRSGLAVYALRGQRALDEIRTMPSAWQRVLDLNDWTLRLTPDEAARLRAELAELVGRYRRDTPEAAAGAPAGAQRVGLITQLLPELDTTGTGGGAAEE